jgi:hypothetical protein
MVDCRVVVDGFDLLEGLVKLPNIEGNFSCFGGSEEMGWLDFGDLNSFIDEGLLWVLV